MEERRGKGGLAVPGMFSEAAATGVVSLKLLAGFKPCLFMEGDASRLMEMRKIKAAEVVLL